jgi:hypothetical protein
VPAAYKRVLSIEQQLLILSEAIQHESFEMDTGRICAILVEAAETILELRRSETRSCADEMERRSR